MKTMFKLAILASGRGSNFASIVEKIEAGEVPAGVDVLNARGQRKIR